MNRPVIVLDVETRPDPEWLAREDARDAWCAALKPPANYKHRDAIEKWITEQVVARADKAALSPMDGMIRAIGWCVEPSRDPDLIENVCVEVGYEFDVLDEFFDRLHDIDGCALAGWHIRTFDVPWITARAAVHGIRLPAWWPHPRDYRHIIDGADVLTTGSLQLWAMRMGLEKKSATGADSLAMSDEELRDYCAQDVRVTRQLLLRLFPRMGST